MTGLCLLYPCHCSYLSYCFQKRLRIPAIWKELSYIEELLNFLTCAKVHRCLILSCPHGIWMCFLINPEYISTSHRHADLWEVLGEGHLPSSYLCYAHVWDTLTIERCQVSGCWSCLFLTSIQANVFLKTPYALRPPGGHSCQKDNTFSFGSLKVNAWRESLLANGGHLSISQLYKQYIWDVQ